MSGRAIRMAVTGAFCASLVAGCGSIGDLLSFGSGPSERSPAPQGAIDFQCAGGRHLYVRYLAGGAAWVILPEREFRLGRLQEGRCGNGSTTLEVKGNEATLTEGATATYAGCRSGAK